MSLPVSSTAERVTTTSLLRIAVAGVTVIMAHTITGGSFSTRVIVVLDTAKVATGKKIMEFSLVLYLIR